ncbi:MAG: PQQ-like beta-propeller repeat protein [Phycisphaeraceae bacterium]|nr:PQQ-like beta-propeller repeat protein [Phycisphaeraceae bacterium]
MTPPPAQPGRSGATRWVSWGLPLLLMAISIAALAWWLQPATTAQPVRVPGMDRPAASAQPAEQINPAHGAWSQGPGQPSTMFRGNWPGFRGQARDGIAPPQPNLATSWPPAGPPVRWRVELGEGYAGAAIDHGCAYVLDYDRAAQADVLRCLSMDDGRDVWRFSYPVQVKRNHGMSRTTPAVDSHHVVTLGPKCHVLCVDAHTGQPKWGMNLVSQFGATVPPWYAGQCPLIDEGRVILAPAGPEALMIAVDADTGDILWTTPNPRKWPMSHASITPMTLAGTRTLVYPAHGGVAGVDSRTGKLLWTTDSWKISIATVPSAVDLGAGRILLSGGYDAGAMIVEVTQQDDQWQVREVVKLSADVFGAPQQTPIFDPRRRAIFGIPQDGQLACLDPLGHVLWRSGDSSRFGLGPLLLTGGLLLALNDDGLLTLAAVSPDRYQPLAQFRILPGHESWGPLALADGLLLARDLTAMVCVDLRQ